MTKVRPIGFAAVLFSELVAPVTARHVNRSGQSIFCATREAGNPHSK
jgi:hypothetical protein